MSCAACISNSESSRLAASESAPGVTPQAAPPEWEPAWADEFDRDGRPDPANWGYVTGDGTQFGLPPGWGNNEVEWYTNDRAENARVENGLLIIEARHDGFDGHEYTSARLASAGKRDFTYGRVEVRAKLPKGRGTWPAIWMLPTEWTYGDKGWPANGEVDLMELVSGEPDTVHTSAHMQDHNFKRGTQITAKHKNPTFTSDFHLFALEWLPESLTWFIDGEKVLSYDNPGTGFAAWPFDKNFHVLLNVALGGWGGAPDASALPQRMEVDYVRVQRLKR